MSFRQILADAVPDGDTVLTIGVFDGVHRGHRHLLDRLIQRSQPGCRSAVVTFSNHPAAVLRPDHPVSFLTTPEEKIGLLRQHGIELVIPLEFTPELSQVGADEFARLLVNSLRMKGLVVGPDFAFGRGRQGNEAYLKEVGRELGFWVETVDPLLVDGGPVGAGASARRFPAETWSSETGCWAASFNCPVKSSVATAGAGSWGSPRPM